MMFNVLAVRLDDGDAIPLLSCAVWLNGVPIGEELNKVFRESVLEVTRTFDSYQHQHESPSRSVKILANENTQLIGLVLANVDAIIPDDYVTSALEQQGGNLLSKWLEQAEEEERDAI